jgi:hypothetical protein
MSPFPAGPLPTPRKQKWDEHNESSWDIFVTLASPSYGLPIWESTFALVLQKTPVDTFTGMAYRASRTVAQRRTELPKLPGFENPSV